MPVFSFQRAALAVLLGLLANAVVVAITEWLAHRFLGGANALADLDAVQQQAAMAFLEPRQLLLVLVGAWLGAWAAGVAVGRTAPGVWGAVLAVAVLVVGTNALNAFALPHPTWFRVLAVVLPEPLVWWGARRRGG